MGQRKVHIGFAVLVTAATVAVAPGRAAAQDSTIVFPVLIDGTAAGSASIAANLPIDGVILQQTTDPHLPANQIESARQTSVVLTTADPTLIAAAENWIKSNNSGAKNTVQPKTVEIDRVAPEKPTLRFRLTGAWPSKVERISGTTVITVVYQRLEQIP